jgi:hypothetical protein
MSRGFVVALVSIALFIMGFAGFVVGVMSEVGARSAELSEKTTRIIDAGKPDPDLPASAVYENLTALGYVASTHDVNSHLRGVIQHDEGAYPGLNLYAAREHGALLIDMDGNVVKQWKGNKNWDHVQLTSDGGVVAIETDQAIVKVDRDSNEIWRYPVGVHHDLNMTEDGMIYALVRKLEKVVELADASVLVDGILILSPDGKRAGYINLLDSIRNSQYSFLLPRWYSRDDPLHANSVQFLDGSVPGDLLARGNILVSFRSISSIAILSPAGKILWLWGPSNLAFQHHANLLPSGHITVFNNRTEKSEIVEMDPRTNRVHWVYRADDFFSRTCGSVQRLPNNNTLVTESDTGYVFEVTPEGDRVWTWANPGVDENGNRTSVWRMQRIPLHDPRLSFIVMNDEIS